MYGRYQFYMFSLFRSISGVYSFNTYSAIACKLHFPSNGRRLERTADHPYYLFTRTTLTRVAQHVFLDVSHTREGFIANWAFRLVLSGLCMQPCVHPHYPGTSELLCANLTVVQLPRMCPHMHL